LEGKLGPIDFLYFVSNILLGVDWSASPFRPHRPKREIHVIQILSMNPMESGKSVAEKVLEAAG